jgi:hypothetical protein
MKRTARAMSLLAALGGGCMAQQTTPATHAGRFNQPAMAQEAEGLIGPWGQPVPVVARGASPDSGIQLVSATSGSSAAGKAVAKDAPKDGLKKLKNGAVPPPPPAGPPGAVAAVPGPALPGGLPPQGTARSSVRFIGQDGMRIAWFAPLPDGKLGFREQLETPGRYNFLQGGIYRLRLSNIPKRANLFLYPTIEVKPQTPKTGTFLAHSSIPVTFTDDDIEQVVAGNMVTKVIYLPDPAYQDLAVPGPDEIVSTRLEPGVDPELEAQRRGTVLLVIRLGNIDLETQGTPAMDAPNPYLRPPMPPMMPGNPNAPRLTPLPGGPMGPMGPMGPTGPLGKPSGASLPMPKSSGAVTLP